MKSIGNRLLDPIKKLPLTIKVFCAGAIIGLIASWAYLLCGGDYWLFIPRWAEIVFYPGFIVGNYCYDLFGIESLAVVVGTLAVGLSYGILSVVILSIWKLLTGKKKTTGANMKNTLIPILLISLLLTGCSSAPQKNKSFFTQEQQSEIREIVNSHLTEQDWEKIQQTFDDAKKRIKMVPDIDIKNDYDKDPMVLMFLSQYPHDNPNFQKELSEFLLRSLSSSPEMQKMRDGAKGDV